MIPAVSSLELNRKLLDCIRHHFLLIRNIPIPSKAIDVDHAPLARCCDEGFLVARHWAVLAVRQ